MCDSERPSTLLNELYQIGEDMRTALSSDDLEAFFAALETRTALIERLKAHEAPDPRPAEWTVLSDRLQRQHEALAAAVHQQRQRIDQLLNHQQQYKKARAGYQPADQQPPRNVLHRNVHG